MPNYVTHELFGMRVQDQLPLELRRVLEREPEAYHCGLFGPDPLMFIPGGILHSRLLHKRWREVDILPLQNIMEWGSDGEKSFAAGYLTHLLLDDVCHGLIYQWMADLGLSHRGLEVGLDLLLMKTEGKSRYASPEIHDRKRISELAGDLIFPIKPLEFRLGIHSMSLLCKQMNSVSHIYRRKFNEDYRKPLEELHRAFHDTVDTAVMVIEMLSNGVMQPVPVQQEGLIYQAS